MRRTQRKRWIDIRTLRRRKRLSTWRRNFRRRNSFGNMRRWRRRKECRAGSASRRHAEQLILSGQVVVNGRVVTELGSKADPEKDKIEAAGRTIKDEQRRSVYMLMHKPAEVVSSLADPEGRKNLRNLLRGFPERV